MNISFVVAMSENHVIGNDGGLPWHLPEDLKHFRQLTLGKNILMGRKTFDSIKQVLPQRTNYVLTRNKDFSFPGVQVFHDKAEVLQSGIKDLIVIGGEEIFKLFLPDCQTIYLTLVHTVLRGDTSFPLFFDFKEIDREFHPADDNHIFGYTFIAYKR